MPCCNARISQLNARRSAGPPWDAGGKILPEGPATIFPRDTIGTSTPNQTIEFHSGATRTKTDDP